MRIFEMMFGKKKPQFAERIWLTTQGKINDLLSQLRSNTERGLNSVVVTHFQVTHQSLLEIFAKGGINCHVIKSSSQFPSSMPDVFNQKGQILMLTSEAIPSFVARAISAQPKNATLSPVSVNLIEHYPLLERDQRVLDLDMFWPMRLEFTSYTSLDEPWLSSFGVDRIRNIFPKLGMDKEEVLEHPMLIQSIQSAQKKLARQVSHEQICASCQEWVRKNLNRGA
jgi:hypothetical protein